MHDVDQFPCARLPTHSAGNCSAPEFQAPGERALQAAVAVHTCTAARVLTKRNNRQLAPPWISPPAQTVKLFDLLVRKLPQAFRIVGKPFCSLKAVVHYTCESGAVGILLQQVVCDFVRSRTSQPYRHGLGVLSKLRVTVCRGLRGSR